MKSLGRNIFVDVYTALITDVSNYFPSALAKNEYHYSYVNTLVNFTISIFAYLQT